MDILFYLFFLFLATVILVWGGYCLCAFCQRARSWCAGIGAFFVVVLFMITTYLACTGYVWSLLYWVATFRGALSSAAIAKENIVFLSMITRVTLMFTVGAYIIPMTWLSTKKSAALSRISVLWHDVHVLLPLCIGGTIVVTLQFYSGEWWWVYNGVVVALYIIILVPSRYALVKHHAQPAT